METLNDSTVSVEKRTPLTNNERKKRYRGNLTEKQKEDTKVLDRDRNRLKRITEKLTQVQLDEKRLKDRARQARHRAKKSSKQPAAIKMGFKTKQSKGKAMSRVKKSLPSTPTKRAEVVKELFQSLSPSTRSKIAHPQQGTCSNSLSEETKQLLQAFYQEDVNSRIMPGKKDVLSVKGQVEERKK